MQALNSNGRRVSLLNEPDAPQYCSGGVPDAVSGVAYPRYRAYQAYDARPPSNAPELSRSGSFDSQVSHGPATPLTPGPPHHDYAIGYSASDFSLPFYGCQSDDYHPHSDATEGVYMANPAAFGLTHAASPQTSSSAEKESASERKGKRYPCRYARELHCDKTFTTSGHASRHSKIHQAVKTVSCTFEDCPKMFTRSDNMKQHLETHFKKTGDKSQRSGPSGRSSGSPSKSGADQTASRTRNPHHNSSAPSPEDADYYSHSPSDVHVRYSDGSEKPRPSIDGISLVVLANAARQVGDM